MVKFKNQPHLLMVKVMHVITFLNLQASASSLSHSTDVWVGAFMATEFSKIFSGCRPCHMVHINWHSRDLLCLHHQRDADWIGL